MSITINGTSGISGVDGSASTPALQGTDTNTGVFFGTDTVTISTGGIAGVTVDSGQRTKFPTTIGVGGATPSTSGSGVSFPATQSASTDANTLDDYEEGTWTPSIVGSSTAGTTTYSGRSGLYIKIGKQVWIQFDANVTNMTGTGNLIINNLPFTSASGTAQSGCCMSTNLDYPSGSQLNLYMGSGATTATFMTNGDNIAWANVQVDTAFEVNGTLCYQASA